MKVSPASTLRNTESMVRINFTPHGRAQDHTRALYCVFPIWLQPQGKDEFPRRTLTGNSLYKLQVPLSASR